MAKLTCVYRQEEISGMKFGKRQLPLVAGDNNLMMLMDLNAKGLVFDHQNVRGKDLEEFTRKYNILSQDELKKSLEVTRSEFISVLSQSVPCVGCRRSVERLYFQLMTSGYTTLDPIIITEPGVLTVLEEKINSPQAICTLLHKHDVLLNSLLENQPRNKKSSRCSLHSLDSFRSRPFSDVWRDVWNCMKQQCRDEIAHIDAQELHNTLDCYLKKHKFCQECRTKVDKAYGLLVNESNPAKEKGYVAALYNNIKKCIADKHIHLQTKADFIDSLIKRAEPELNGSNSRHRERHAKTLEIAQEEVLTCIGMCIYERLRRVHVCLKEEENACQVLAAVGVHALCRNFDMAVEKKQGISNLELLYQEISRAEKVKEFRKEQKKLKKKKKKNEKKNLGTRLTFDALDSVESTSPWECIINDNGYYVDNEDEQEIDICCSSSDGSSGICTVGKKGSVNGGERNMLKKQDILKTNSRCCMNNNITTKVKNFNTKSGNLIIVKTKFSDASCNSCVNNINGCTKFIDGGYVSEPSSHHEESCSMLSISNNNSRTSSIVSTPEGSEVACSDGFCNHHEQLHIIRNGNNSVGCTSSENNNCTHVQNDKKQLTLQQMLKASSDERETANIIPDEVVEDFKCRENSINKLREELRKKLRNNFAQLCVKTRTAQKVCNN